MILHCYGRSAITLLTVYGYIRYTRTVLRPRGKEQIALLKEMTGGKSVVPLDIALGVDRLPFTITTKMMLKIVRDAIEAKSYGDVEKRYKEEYGIEISDDQIRLVVDYVGKKVYAADQEMARNAEEELRKNIQLNKLNREEIGVLYLEMDGAMVNTRGVENESCWREVKTAMTFNSQYIHYWNNRKTGEICSKIEKKDFVSFIGNCHEFRSHVIALLQRNRAYEAEEVVVITDGADWISKLVNDICPHAIHILDLYHLKENVWKFAKFIYHNDTAKYTPWANRICDLLEAGKWDIVLHEIEEYKEKPTPDGTVNLYTYIYNHRDNIDYPLYKKKGYFVGSGAMESANRYVMQERLKLPGMRWNVESAQGILALRTRSESQNWHEVESILLNSIRAEMDICKNF